MTKNYLVLKIFYEKLKLGKHKGGNDDIDRVHKDSKLTNDVKITVSLA